ncbi:hypothetical protein CDEST_02462 [Colletotrichum destructivum]|uniref:Uncharacterized protein n=1 Tax=Colletotrichum destructivum TaxID=34406 RepID=A0AAX4I254_9PEZI|nr:hypothetical protein CDEST_02462 [Colletotrichum destructivum]
MAIGMKQKQNAKTSSQETPLSSTSLSTITSKTSINNDSSASYTSQSIESAHATTQNLTSIHITTTENDGHCVSIESPKLWYFGTNTWVAHPHEIPVPSNLISKWPEIKERLVVDLQDVRTEMMAEQARERRRCKREPKRRHIVPEMRMSGRRNNLFSDSVTISPCVWILCGSKSCRDKVRRIVKTLTLPINFVQQPVEVHDGAPEFNATRASIPLSQLQRDLDMDMGLRHLGGVILHHMEAAGGPGKHQSACGLLCCATFLNNGKVLKQRVSRVGGLLALDNIECPIAMTTSHGIFDCLWLDKQEIEMPARPGSPLADTLLLNNDDDFTYASISESDSDSEIDTDDGTVNLGSGKDKAVRGSCEHRSLLGRKDASKVDKWISLDEIVGIKFIGQQFPGREDDPGVSRPGDYALLRSNTLQDLRNLLSVPENIEIVLNTKKEELLEGPLTMVFGADNLLEVVLLPESATMPSERGDLPVRKVQLPAPLAPGTSGTWIVKGTSLVGMVVAAYPGQPLAMFMTAEDILQSIAESFPQVQEAAYWRQVASLSGTKNRQWGNSERSTKHADETESSLGISTVGTFSVGAETELTSLPSVLDQPLSVAKEERTKIKPQQKNKSQRVPTEHKATGKVPGKLRVEKNHSKTSSSKSSSKRAPVYVNVWYCDACRYGPLNPYSDAHCANCGHQRCYDCTTTVMKQNPGC